MNTQNSIFKELHDKYSTLPGLQCGQCWGECCVSPTMTAIEFVYMMLGAQETMDKTTLLKFIQEPIKEHLFYAGNAHCRFQDMVNGRCQNYETRAMACRLHGHEALRAYQTDDLEFCDKKPDHNKTLSVEGLDRRLETIRDYNDSLEIPYAEPWYFCSLNLESWLDFYYTPSLCEGRPVLAQIQRTIHSMLSLPLINQKVQLTTLTAQLKTIEHLYRAISEGDGALVLDLLNDILEGFPSTGSYYLDEANQMKKILLDSQKD